MKGTKESLSKRALDRKLSSSNGRRLCECALFLFSGVLLADVKIGTYSVPLAACVVLSVPFGVRTVIAALGAVGGMLLRYEMVDAAEGIALVTLFFAASAVFYGSNLSAKLWFWTSLAAAVCAALGVISLLGSKNQLMPWLLRWVAIGLGAGAYRAAMSGNRHAQVFWLSTLIASLRGMGAPFDIGLFCAVAVGVFVRQPITCVSLGLALDLAGSSSFGAALALLIPTLLFSRSRQRESLRGVAYLVFTILTPAIMGSFSPAITLTVSLATMVGIVLRHYFPVPRFAQELPETDSAEKLDTAAELLELLSRQIPQDITKTVGEAESVYDGAAEQICRCCGKFSRCWRQNANLTLAALSDASKIILERGVAQSTDFPKSFRDSCCHLEGFVTAINQELDGLLFRRRYQVELQESRQVLAEEFHCVGAYLRGATQTVCEGRAVYQATVGACSVGKNGSRVSGDRGVCFAGGGQDYYVILCDGMGTGREAARCSTETVRFLERLLRSGMEAQSTLRILNGMELLRETDTFTTIDLLRIDLEKGEGTLYKWGSAPSFWKGEETVKKIGTASPPPGVGVGGDHAPEQYRLSLKRGEMLVLASDGAVCPQTESTIWDYCGGSVHELAAIIIAEAPPEDDVSAVVISLKPCG